MDMKVCFPGGLRVDCDYRGATIETDQPASSGGEGSAPGPFTLFLASIPTCVGYFMLRFMRQRDIPADDVTLDVSIDYNDEEHRVEKMTVKVNLPEGFPEKYNGALLRSADQCTVKRHLENPPEIEVVMGDSK